MTVPRLVHGRRSQHFDCTPRGARSRRVRDGARGGAKCPHLQNRPLQSSAQRNPRPSSCSHLGSKLPPFDMGAQSPASFCNANDLVLAALVASTAVRDAFVGHPTHRIVLTRPVTAGQAPHPRLPWVNSCRSCGHSSAGASNPRSPTGIDESCTAPDPLAARQRIGRRPASGATAAPAR
jgi:hypothetical protein